MQPDDLYAPWTRTRSDFELMDAEMEGRSHAVRGLSWSGPYLRAFFRHTYKARPATQLNSISQYAVQILQHPASPLDTYFRPFPHLGIRFHFPHSLHYTGKRNCPQCCYTLHWPDNLHRCSSIRWYLEKKRNPKGQHPRDDNSLLLS